MTGSAGRRSGALAALVVILGGLSSAGCGPGAPRAESSLAEATVTGTVRSSSRPVAGGQVLFDPSNVNRPTQSARTAEIGPDGTYRVTTLVGQNRVTVALPGRRPGAKTKAPPAPSPPVQRICDVKAGEANTFDIVLP